MNRADHLARRDYCARVREVRSNEIAGHSPKSDRHLVAVRKRAKERENVEATITDILEIINCRASPSRLSG